MPQSVYNARQVKESLHNIAKRLSSIVNDVRNDQVIILTDTVKLQTRLQLLFNLKWQNEVEKSIYDIIVEHAITAEKMGPGSFDKTIKTICDHLSETHELTSEKMNTRLGTMPTKDDISWLISTYCNDDFVSKMLIDSLELSGFGGKVTLEKSNSHVSSIELIRGYTFDVDLGFSVATRLESPRVVLIDGFVESVHEINSLLVEASTTKENVLLFTRGFADDVISTLQVNHNRGSLNVIPIIVKFDFEGINTLADLVTISNSNLVSTLKGELISSVKLQNSCMVEYADVFPGKVVIKNDSTTSQVYNHVVNLRNKRLAENEDTVASFIDKRIKSLSPNQVVIRLADDQNFIRNSQSIDYVLRAYRSLLTHGTMIFNNEKMLSSTVVSTDLQSNKCLETLYTLGAIVT